MYLLWDSYDVDWLKDTAGIEDPSSIATTASDFMLSCLGVEGPAKGYLRYNATSQAVVVPNIVTVAAVLDIVPLEDGSSFIVETQPPLLFDALDLWKGFSSLNATEYVFDQWGYETSTMSKMNPGYDQSVAARAPVDPPLTKQPDPRLIDFIVKEKLSTFISLTGVSVVLWSTTWK